MKRAAFLSTLIVLCVCVFVSCGNVKHEACCFEVGVEQIQESFVENNKINGGSYKNPNYDPSNSDSEEYYWHESDVNQIVKTIMSEEEYNNVFTERVCEVNFESEMLILTIFGSSDSDFKIKDISTSNNNLYIKLKPKAKISDFLNTIFGVNTGIQPTPHYVVIKMPKSIYNSINVEIYI